MRVLMIDNYDSFTYNLVQYLGELGAEVETVRNDAATVDDLLGARLGPRGRLARPVHAERGGHLGRGRCAASPRPGCRTLGVCLGHQSLAQAFGGRVVRHLPVHGKATEIDHDGEGIFAGLPSPLRRRALPLAGGRPRPARRASSATAHGGGVLMAMRHRELPANGVQFHPESVLTPDGQAAAGELPCLTR